MGHNKRRITKPFIASLVAASVGFFAFSAQALKSDDDSLVEGAKLCTRYLPRHERQYGIPEHLLAAIASTESGRFHRALGLNLPWPWTINVEGQGHFYDTKEEAIAAVREYQMRGFASIDVGCMQVNLHHHPRAFASLDQAFDPAYNVAYAAQFLKKNFQDEGSWRKATADYHSRTLSYGDPYASLVYGAWNRIITKVADARAGRPILTASAGRSASPVMTSSNAYRSLRMHSISVARDTTRENGVLVIRPDYNSQPALAPAKPEENVVSYLEHKSTDAPTAPAASAEKSTIASGGIAMASATPEVNRGAQIVKIRSDGSISEKGQFQPASRIVHPGTSAASFATPNGGTKDAQTSSVKSPFVFDN